MSARSMKRAYARANRGVGRKAALGTAAILGAGAMAAGSAHAATFPVTNTTDGGAGSLRDAITAANGSAGADTITFTGSGASGRIQLTGDLPQITSPVNIQGPGASALTIDGASDYQPFSIGAIVAADQPVSISGLRMTNADSGGDGGTILNEPDGGNASELTVSNLNIVNSYADGNGGAIYSDGGSLTVQGTTISRSTSSGKYAGGAIAVGTTDGDTPTEVIISGSKITKNAAGDGGGGVYLGSPAGDISITDTTISGNTSFDDGGGIYIAGPGATATTRITSSTISDNESFDVGGALDGSSLGEGLVVSDTTISGNYADFGGGLYLYNGSDSPVTVSNSTIAGNGALRKGGGIYRYGDPGDQLTISSSIVAANTAEEGNPDISQYAAAGQAITAGNSLIGSVTGLAPAINQTPAGTNKIGVDPQLGPLADNGGPTQTMLPALASPAVDAGVAGGLTSDQRGLARTVIQPTVPLSAGSDGTDIGAVELAAVPAPDVKVDGAKVSAKKTQKQKGKKVVIAVKAGAAEDVTVDAKGSIKLGKTKFALKALTKQAKAGKQLTLKLKPKQKSASGKILDGLANGDKAKASVDVTLTDTGGATAKQKLTIKLK